MIRPLLTKLYVGNVGRRGWVMEAMNWECWKPLVANVGNRELGMLEVVRRECWKLCAGNVGSRELGQLEAVSGECWKP